MPTVWIDDIETTMNETVQTVDKSVRAYIRQVMRFYEPVIETHMKKNASWTDRTGNARQSLQANFEHDGADIYALTFDYGVDYGVFLEFANAGRYAIIRPTLEIFQKAIFERIKLTLES